MSLLISTLVTDRASKPSCNDALPTVSVITTVYNGVKYLEQTIQSVLNQTYPSLEYIIVDGGSTDGTIEIIKKYADRIDKWVSEPDGGISDAFNKGVKLSTGDYINFQGADDYLLADDVVEKMMKDVNPDVDMLVCGKIERVANTQEKQIIFMTDGRFKKSSLLFRMALPHQALFMNRKYFNKYGLFDLNNKYCMDYEILLRAYKEFPEVTMKDVFVSAWRDGGIGADRTMKVYQEYFNVKNKHRIAPVIILKFILYLSVVKYYIKMVLIRLGLYK